MAFANDQGVPEMCGIVAIFKSTAKACSAQVLFQMREDVAHRGPDDQGAVFFGEGMVSLTEPSPEDTRWNVGLGHRRLSILDLSPSGHQPMSYRDRYWTVYNGEVYNFLELRAELEKAGHSFKSTSDTEVILAAYAEWGTECFQRFRGMWGLVIVDTLRREAVLSRDRLGIKPLYLWRNDGMLAVTSEIKQFLSLPGFRSIMDQVVAAQYLQTGYEHLDRTFFEGVRPLSAGTWCRVPLDTLEQEPEESYWHPETIQPIIHDPVEAGHLFADKLQESIRLHMRSDVPVGCALSGGLDSSSIATAVHRLQGGRGEPIHTFTSTFPGDPADERKYVDAVLDRIHANPHFITPDPDDFLVDLDRFLWAHDEPVGSFSVYAAYCVARLARDAGVPVALNGQGGDEILSGYWQTFFVYLQSLARKGRILPLAGQFAGALMPNGNPELLGQLPVMLRRYLARRSPHPGVRLLGSAASNGSDILDHILSLDGQARRIYEIREMFLPRLLKWDDRNFMAFGVEGRYPFIDHDLVELCLAFSSSALFHRGWVKWPLRVGLEDLLPPDILGRRTKYGFEVPQDRWLCGELKPVIESWLKEDRPVWDLVERQGIQRLAEETWQLKGKRDEPGQVLLRVFFFDRWLEIFGVSVGPWRDNLCIR